MVHHLEDLVAHGDAFRSIEQCVRARIWMSSTRPGSGYRVLVNTVMNLRGGVISS